MCQKLNGKSGCATWKDNTQELNSIEIRKSCRKNEHRIFVVVVCGIVPTFRTKHNEMN